MDFSFPRYLLAKQSVDDRALNKDVFNALNSRLPDQPLRIIEIGAGIGTMPARLIRWNALRKAEYVLVDEVPANMDYAREWLEQWAVNFGLGVEKRGRNLLRLHDDDHDIHLYFESADVLDFAQNNRQAGDLLIAHAFLDLLPLPSGLQEILLLTRNLAWLTINFDAGTTFEPEIDVLLDRSIEHLYHQSMDLRAGGGDSKSGRHLIRHLQNLKLDILSAGASDWVVYPRHQGYPADEAYFLYCMLHFLESSLKENPGMDPAQLENWLSQRSGQIERGELIYIAHQMDLLVKV